MPPELLANPKVTIIKQTTVVSRLPLREGMCLPVCPLGPRKTDNCRGWSCCSMTGGEPYLELDVANAQAQHLCATQAAQQHSGLPVQLQEHSNSMAAAMANGGVPCPATAASGERSSGPAVIPAATMQHAPLPTLPDDGASSCLAIGPRVPCQCASVLG